MHAWSEVEHDLVYKPMQGTLSEEELAILDELNGLVLTGEIALERLQAAGNERIQNSKATFANQFELASYLYNYLSNNSFRKISSFVWEILSCCSAFKQLKDITGKRYRTYRKVCKI